MRLEELLKITPVGEIIGFPGYRVGSNGSVWSCLRRGHKSRLFDEWVEIIGGRDKDGYRKVILCQDGKRRYCRVCCLVLEAFKGPRPPGHTAAHENGINDDDRADNLFWKTQKDNIADKKRHGTYQEGDKASRRKLTSIQVLAMRAMRCRGLTYREIAGAFGVHLSTAEAAVNGRNWKSL